MKTALKITGFYLIVALLWILLSDWAALWIFGEDIIKLKLIQTTKGILFVITTAVVLFILIKRYHAALDQKIKDLEHLNQELKNSNRELEQFAYVVSHDLQEPLRMVTNFMSQLQNKYGDKLDQKAKQYIFYAVDGATRMRQIILDLLDYSRVGQDYIKKEEVAIQNIVEEFCRFQHENIKFKNAEIIFENLPVVKSYKTALQQIFYNLLDNALKYSKEDIAPKIYIKAEERENDWLFSISDNGIGIPVQFFKEIFVIFRRLHDRENYSGTGIGLAIVKKNIEKMKGELWLESKEGEGSTFYFTIKK